VVLRTDVLDAVLFDMDGVVTRTATLHAAAWKQVFDDFLRARSSSTPLFDPESDYLTYVDGKPRYDGVASFLESRGISLSYGNPDDPPDRESICGIGNRKDAIFEPLISPGKVEVFESTVQLIWALRETGLKTGVFSASRHAEQVLAAAGALSLFDAKVDGVDAAALGLPGKPHPATLLELAGRLEVRPERAAVVEDAIAGVQAARAGGFALVIGVNRAGREGLLLASGADYEVSDLSAVRLRPGREA
jgi:beta-phosphoglucomutase family hydrolase